MEFSKMFSWLMKCQHMQLRSPLSFHSVALCKRMLLIRKNGIKILSTDQIFYQEPFEGPIHNGLNHFRAHRSSEKYHSQSCWIFFFFFFLSFLSCFTSQTLICFSCVPQSILFFEMGLLKSKVCTTWFVLQKWGSKECFDGRKLKHG